MRLREWFTKGRDGNRSREEQETAGGRSESGMPGCMKDRWRRNAEEDRWSGDEERTRIGRETSVLHGLF